MPPSPTPPRPSITLTEDGKDQGELIDDTQWYIGDTQWYIVHKIDNRNDNILIDNVQ